MYMTGYDRTFSFLFTFSGELWCLCDFHLWENSNFVNFLLTEKLKIKTRDWKLFI